MGYRSSDRRFGTEHARHGLEKRSLGAVRIGMARVFLGNG
jgi:hypothetical protein